MTGRPSDVVVLGCGRSGTSMVAGLLAGAGYRLGGRLLDADPSNPRGYFEDTGTQRLNDLILDPYVAEHAAGPPVPRFVPAIPGHPEVRDGRRWLAILPPEVAVRPVPALAGELAASLGGGADPWCRKDPRFCYTLPAWEPVLGDAVRVCVFREPQRTANSMLAWAARRGGLGLTYPGALEVWAAAYAQVLRRHRNRGRWFFAHYEQVLDGSALAGLADLLGRPLDGGFADRSLRRSPADGDVPPPVARLYGELRELAGFAGR